MTTRSFTSVFALVLLASSASANVPGLMSAQGLLKDGTGDPVADGSYFVTFRIFDVPAGGSPLWADTQTVSTTDGLFNATLGLGTAIPDTVFKGPARYLGISVFPDGEMIPRQRMTTSAYSFNTAVVGANTQDYVAKWDGFALVSGMIYDNGSRVGIGTNTPSELLEVAGTVHASGLGGGFRFPDGSLQTTAATTSSVVYTRWGRSVCPASSSLVYAGIVGGSHYTHSGAGSNLLCMTLTPTWDEFNGSSQNGALMYGGEYETSSYGVASLALLHDLEVPCAVCLREPAKAVIMQPGTQVCPAGWSLEYAGYLMSENYQHAASSEFVCVDRQATGTGSAANQNGALFYPTEAECGALPCPSYVQDREITCSVCSKQ